MEIYFSAECEAVPPDTRGQYDPKEQLIRMTMMMYKETTRI